MKQLPSDAKNRDNVHMEQFEESLVECRDLLRKHAEDFWADKIDALLRSHLRPYDLASQVRGWFGGMGAFNDLIICPMNHHRIANSEVDAVNERLRTLQNTLYEQVRELMRREA